MTWRTTKANKVTFELASINWSVAQLLENSESHKVFLLFTCGIRLVCAYLEI